MKSPPRKAPGELSNTGRKLITLAGYHALVFRAKMLRFVQKPFYAVCWNIEQRASKVEDRIENQKADE